VPAGLVSIPLAYVEWLVLMVAGMGLALCVSRAFVLTMLGLWIMGCLYNVPPIRTKDLPYLDVLSEAINNPLRMLAGWFIVNPPAVTPASLLISYWMVGCYFMAVKRFAELREINQTGTAASYRRSFAHYNEPRLLVSLTFYGSTAMLFFGAFIMRYRLELILAFPMVAIVMAMYLALAFKSDSAAQAPEKLYREPALMVPVSLCTVLMVALLFVDLPVMHRVFAPMAPTQAHADADSIPSSSSPSMVAGKLP
jgi:4-hydroxybenzoate polyprenyltransferase